MEGPAYAVRPCPADAVERLQVALGVQRVTAEVLVRRGLGDADEARRFLELEGSLHDPFGLGAMDAACAAVDAALAQGRRIVVHGDYDVDGVCATALLVETLRDLGGDVGWHLPSRFVEGYGLAVETVEAVAAEGVGLLVTVDCGITAVEPVARARTLGLDVVVTDHHRPGPVLPDAPLVAARGPYEDAYGFGELSGTGVAYKLAQALWARRGHDPAGQPPPELARQLDLVALATVADVVPLRDENRALVRAGMRRLSRAERPGLAALMRSAGVDRARLRGSDLGFRLGPRINAAGRLGHPGVALDLLLTPDAREASELAERLEALNRERQGVEDSILRAATAELERLDAGTRGSMAHVLWGEGWHEGVIGIVASRLVERCGRPVVLVSLDGDRGKGSGRSVPAYDLHAGLTACAQHLQRFGGHRAAAGLTIAAERLPAFAAALRAHAAAALDGRDLRRLHPVDAVVPLGELSIELARELARLEPHGLGNPAVSLLVPAAELSAVETMGDGRHVRLQVSTGAARCSGVAFGRGADADAFRSGGRHDVLCRAEVNEWRGSASLRLLVRDVLRLPAAAAGALGEQRVAPPVGELVALAAAPGAATVVDLRGADAALASILRCALSGERTLVVVCDVARRAAIFETVAAPWRFGLPAAVPVSARGAAGEQAARLAELGDGPALVVADHWALARHDVLRTGFPHVIVLDPPAHPDEEAVLRGVAAGVRVELVYGEREIAFARRALDALALDHLVATLAAAAPSGGALSESELDRLAAWPQPAPPAEAVSRAIAVLVECGAARREGEKVELAEGAGSRFDPARSPAWQRAEERRLAAHAHLDALAAALRGAAVVGQARPAAV